MDFTISELFSHHHSKRPLLRKQKYIIKYHKLFNVANNVISSKLEELTALNLICLFICLFQLDKSQHGNFRAFHAHHFFSPRHNDANTYNLNNSNLWENSQGITFKTATFIINLNMNVLNHFGESEVSTNPKTTYDN